jgi:hypothetical protein
MHNICRRHGRHSPGEEVKWLVAYPVGWLVADDVTRVVSERERKLKKKN